VDLWAGQGHARDHSSRPKALDADSGTHPAILASQPTRHASQPIRYSTKPIRYASKPTRYAPEMLTGIDHLVIAVTDPDTAVESIAHRLGVESGGGGRHEGLGTRNRLLWLGDTYLEFITVIDHELAAASWVGAPTIVALGSGGGLAAIAIASDDLASDVERLRSHGSELPDPVTGERSRPDGRVVRWQLAAARLGPDWPPFLIEHDPAGAEWTAPDRAERASTGGRLRVAEVAVDDVPLVTRRATRTLDLRFRPSLSGRGARDADVGGQILRYRPRRHRAEATLTVHLSVAGHEPADFELLGCRWRVAG